MSDDLSDLLAQVRDRHVGRFRKPVVLTDGFCDTHRNTDYKELCREMTAAAARRKSES